MSRALNRVGEKRRYRLKINGFDQFVIEPRLLRAPQKHRLIGAEDGSNQTCFQVWLLPHRRGNFFT